MTPPSYHRLTCSITGTIQGVGFRPALFRLARDQQLGGWVQNQSGRVLLQLDGPDRAALHRFIEALPHRLPPLASITAITPLQDRPLPATIPTAPFHIRASRHDGTPSITIPADVRTCPACRDEIFDPAARRYGYPFTTCTNCGPRYTIVHSLPYDRARTSLAPFPLCPTCRREYTDPGDRRFHAETLACPHCGPTLTLLDSTGRALPGHPLRQVRAALQQGQIVAIMGLGGFQLAVDASQPAAIARLRQRKQRPAKPFALMLPTLSTIQRHCRLTDAARDLLVSAPAPIVILPLHPSSSLPCHVLAPDVTTLGVMLPTSPLHHLLFTPLQNDPTPAFDALIITSGNRHGEPICQTPAEALDQLGDIADVLLVHNREIVWRCDDSVVALQAGHPQLWRRARGYAPRLLPLPHPVARPMLAMGSDFKNTLALAWDGQACLSPHIGDLSALPIAAVHAAMQARLPHFLSRPPEAVVVDLHPDLAATRSGEALATRNGLPLIRIQHHHAHAAACLAEHGHAAGLALAFDGTGWGPDGNIWGAELLDVTPTGCRRLATFAPAPLPGGDAAVVQPLRQLAARLQPFDQLPHDLLYARGITDEQQRVWGTQCQRRINAPLSHAAGRLFDAVACLLSLAPATVSYDGQCAIRLEAAARRARHLPGVLPFTADLQPNELLTIDWSPLFEQLLRTPTVTTEAPAWALAFHHSLARAALQMACHGRDRSPQRHIALTGGVFMNSLLTDLLLPQLTAAGLTPLLHRHLPPNDGGIAFGQLVAATQP